MNRTDARELLMKLLFVMEAQKDFSTGLKESFFAVNGKDQSQEGYLREATHAFLQNQTEIDRKIAISSDHWKLSRMAKVDLAALRVAVSEILYMDDIPDSVSINEAVDMVKKYGSEDSGKFVNGVLGRIVKVKNAQE